MARKGELIQRLSGWLGFGAGVLLAAGLAMPAQAQRMFDWFGGFGSPSPQAPVQREADYSRAPAPKKPDTPPTSTVLVLGDSMADWLAYGLEDALADQPELGVIRKHRTVSGLIRYDARNEAIDWAQAARDAINAEKPQYIVMMVGLNDRQAIRERVQPAPARNAPGQRGAAANQPAQQQAPANAPAQAAPSPTQPTDAEADRAETTAPEPPPIAAPEPAVRGRAAAASLSHEFRSERWAELYTKKIDDTIAAMKSRGVPVFWVGLPSVRGPKSTSDMQYLNELYRGRAEKAGITYIDSWDGFVDDANRFTLQGPDFEGQTRRLRTSDGVHFTKFGARKLAHYVEREIRRSSTRGALAVALPSAEPQQQTPAAGAPKPGGAAQRPLNGPVMPLTTAVTTGDSLLGGAGSQAPSGHVTVTRVLVKGEAVDAPAGRSDDFAWPRRNVAPFGTDPVATTTTLPIPQMQAAPAATTVPVPTGETPAVVAAVRRPAAPRPPPPAPRNNGFFFPFFR
jgi:hypothetical protein